MTISVFDQHAAMCGILLPGTKAVEIADSIGRVTAVSVIDPETMDEILPADEIITPQDQANMLVVGLDYVVCYAYSFALQ